MSVRFRNPETGAIATMPGLLDDPVVWEALLEKIVAGQQAGTLEPLPPWLIAAAFDAAKHPRHPAGSPMGGRFRSITEIQDVHQALGIEVWASESPVGITLSQIKVPAELRGQGYARRALGDVLEYADRTGQTVALTIGHDPADRGLSKAQKLAWYRRHGFVPNKGRNKDFGFTETMVRRPQAITGAFDPNQPRDPGGEGGGQWVKTVAMLEQDPVPPGFPPGIYEPESSVAFWPQKIGHDPENPSEPLWKAFVDEHGNEVAFWFADHQGRPHHDDMLELWEETGGPTNMSEFYGSSIAGYGDETDLYEWRTMDIAQKAELDADEILTLTEAGDTHTLWDKYGVGAGDYEGWTKDEITKMLAEEYLDRFKAVPRRHRRDIKDARAMLQGGLNAAGYDPLQPRDPGGEGGGRWVKVGTGTADVTRDETGVEEKLRAAVEELYRSLERSHPGEYPYDQAEVDKQAGYMLENYRETYEPAFAALEERLKGIPGIRLQASMDDYKVEQMFEQGPHTADISVRFDVPAGQLDPDFGVWFIPPLEGEEFPREAVPVPGGALELHDVLDISDPDFVPADQPDLAGRYADALDDVRGITREGFVTLHRGMSTAEAEAWERGEEIPTGKFFTSSRTADFAQDIAGEFPELYSWKVSRKDVVETEPGIFQLRRPARLREGAITAGAAPVTAAVAFPPTLDWFNGIVAAEGEALERRFQARLRSQYEKIIRRWGRRMAARFRELAPHTQALAASLEEGALELASAHWNAEREVWEAELRAVTAAGEPASWRPPTVEELLGPLLDDLVTVLAGPTATQRLAFEAMVDGVLRRLGISFDVRSIISQAILNGLAARAEGILEGIRTPAARIIANGYLNGLSVPQTADALVEGIDGLAEWQATQLARNDLVGMANGGSLLAARMVHDRFPDVGLGYKEWLATEDERTRPTHNEAHGQRVPIDTPFVVGGAPLAYPGDPSGPDQEVINCRCTLIYRAAPKVVTAAYVESEHPRDPGGEGGGRWIPKGSAGVGVPQADEYTQTEVLEEQEKEIATAAARAGMSKEAYFAQSDEWIRRQLEGREVRIRVPAEDVAAIVESGEYRPTPENRGFDRRPLEQQYFGTDENPVYGYVSGIPEDDGHPVTGYGDAVFRLNPEVAQRATVTVGDSANVLFDPEREGASFVPTPMTHPTHMGIDYRSVGDVVADPRGTNLEDFSGIYVESQVWGGVKMGDVREIVFLNETEPDVATIRAMNRAGVKWSTNPTQDPAPLPPAERPKIGETYQHRTWTTDGTPNGPKEPMTVVADYPDTGSVTVRLSNGTELTHSYRQILNMAGRRPVTAAAFVEQEHPRDPGGDEGGQFIAKGTTGTDEGTDDLWKKPFEDADWKAMLALQEAGKMEEADRLISEARARKNAWTYSTRSALARGELSIEEAVERGYHADGTERGSAGYTWGPLPAEMYHATINAPAVLREGLLTRDERGGAGGGLGGGSSQDISLTTSPEYAADIAVTLRELNSVLNEKTSIQTLIDNATNGVGANEPWIQKIPEIDLKEIRTLAAGDHTNYEGKPMTPDELDWARYKAYTTLTGYYRQEAGGTESTVPFNPDLEVIKRAAPLDIRVVGVSPKAGARGFHVSDAEFEWRVPTGKVLEVKDSLTAAGNQARYPKGTEVDESGKGPGGGRFAPINAPAPNEISPDLDENSEPDPNWMTPGVLQNMQALGGHRERVKSEVVGILSRRLEENPDWAPSKLVDWEPLMRDYQQHELTGTYSDSELAVDALIQTWTVSSSDSNAASLLMQQTVADEFGLDFSVADISGDNDANHVVASAPTKVIESVREFVRAQYAETQEYLKEKERPEFLKTSVARGESEPHYVLFRGMNFMDVYDSPFGGGMSETDYDQNPMSSWALSYDQAYSFTGTDIGGEYEAGAILAAKVPRSRILSTALTGVGCLPETEVVVIGAGHGGKDRAWVFAGEQNELPYDFEAFRAAMETGKIPKRLQTRAKKAKAAAAKAHAKEVAEALGEEYIEGEEE